MVNAKFCQQGSYLTMCLGVSIMPIRIGHIPTVELGVGIHCDHWWGLDVLDLIGTLCQQDRLLDGWRTVAVGWRAIVIMWSPVFIMRRRSIFIMMRDSIFIVWRAIILMRIAILIVRWAVFQVRSLTQF